MAPKTIALLTAAILFLIILLQNTQVVSLRLFFWDISMSRIILLPLVLFIGFIIGFIVAKTTGSHHSKK